MEVALFFLKMQLAISMKSTHLRGLALWATAPAHEGAHAVRLFKNDIDLQKVVGFANELWFATTENSKTRPYGYFGMT